MLIGSPMTTAVLIALVLGGAGSAWVWLVQHRRVVRSFGLSALAAMRWRESSRFIIDALEGQGFTASRLSPDVDQAQKADLLLNRGDQTWLLSFKQGVEYRVDAKMVRQMSAAVRDSNASGGIIATLGRIRGEARKHPENIELIDGGTLWPLVSPLLPPSLHSDVTARARRRTIRASGVAWLGALLVGLAASLLIPTTVFEPARDTAGTTKAPTAASSTPASKPADVGEKMLAPIAATEEEQRRDIAIAVAALPGIDRALWATRSTLVALVHAGASDEQIDGICKVLAPYDDLRYSRVQLQPPPDSGQPVRFLRCPWN